MRSAKLRSGVQGRNFYGRVKGKTLKPAQQRYIDEDLPALQIPGVTVEDNPARTTLALPTLFGDDRPLWLEVGFGGGEHMVHQAQAHPEIGVIGCEPFLNGVAMALGKIRRARVANVRLHAGDVRDLFDVLPDACLQGAFLLYPDPWPKARHHRRRFVTPDHLHPLARVLAPGAAFRIATDIPDYVRQTLEEVPQAGFDPVAQDLHTPWPDWPSTRYEAKALREGRQPQYLTFLRKA